MDKSAIRDLTAQLLLAFDIEGTEELRDTPRRVADAWEEMLDGYEVDTEALLSKTFEDEGQDQVVIVRDIESWSVCAHHLLPFHIQAAVGYLPIDKVLGVSKLERLVHAYAHRLQLQERLSRQIADALMTHLQPLGVGVVIVGDHLCMKCRGVKNKKSTVITSRLLGLFRDNPTLRAEFLSLVKL